MKVALFLDGKNFYSGWRDTRQAQQGGKIDFGAMGKYVVDKVGGSQMVAAHYYTGIEKREDDQARKLNGFLQVLAELPGFFIHEFSRRLNELACSSCDHKIPLTLEKEVDTSLVADMIYYAHVRAYDVAVLFSGDADHRPALRIVQERMGIPVWLATWGQAGVSMALRRAAHSTVDLVEGFSHFSRGGDEGGEAPIIEDPQDLDQQLDAMALEIQNAEERFTGGYVGLNYFVTRWTSAAIPGDINMRRHLLDLLVGQNRVEIYAAGDGSNAIRIKQ